MLTRDQIIDRYESGDSAEDIAAACGVHLTTILRRLRKFGVEIRPCGYQPILDWDEVIGMRQAGATVAVIASSLGYPKDSVKYILKRSREAKQ